MKPHKHAAIIKAWADGADIECRTDPTSSHWIFNKDHSWNKCFEYRIKPEPPRYPQTKMSTDELAQAWADNPGGTIGVANAAIARAIDDKQVYLPPTGGEVVLLSESNGRRLFMVDGEEHVPAAMLMKVANAVYADMQRRATIEVNGLGRSFVCMAHGCDFDRIIASVKEDK